MLFRRNKGIKVDYRRLAEEVIKIQEERGRQYQEPIGTVSEELLTDYKAHMEAADGLRALAYDLSSQYGKITVERKYLWDKIRQEMGVVDSDALRIDLRNGNVYYLKSDEE